ncbi:hypothetical protein [Caldicoprobacter faecalis]|uniref:Uncharacterized protein n=1 Tax=Caldicoprobacter faecalis TaxID=937334 RepID=A0A1I5XXV9_9FIRM|nr:hypothetical protein [Caldicoprobacter faecalis]SFQ36788.1 hypothetical protein SAMN05444406_13217 [Caldicoprobacter faecalis]
MLDIIILFIVISMVVANILKHVGSPGQWPKPNASGRPVTPKNPEVPGQPGDGRGIYRQPGHRQVWMSSAEAEKNVSAERSSVANGYAGEGEGVPDPSLGRMEQVRLTDTAHDVEGPKLEVVSPDAKLPMISLSRNAVINGIIMSELLQPPKALRRKSRY